MLIPLPLRIRSIVLLLILYLFISVYVDSFRRAYRSKEGTLASIKTHYYHRDERGLEGILKVLGAERTPQTLIKLQELKYNRDSTAYALLRREKATISDIKFKTWMS